MTAHRRENHEAMPGICEAVAEIVALPSRPQVLWPVHPSPMVEPVVRKRLGNVPGVRLSPRSTTPTWCRRSGAAASS